MDGTRTTEMHHESDKSDGARCTCTLDMDDILMLVCNLTRKLLQEPSGYYQNLIVLLETADNRYRKPSLVYWEWLGIYRLLTLRA